MVCSHWRQWAGAFTHRLGLTTQVDKRFDGDTCSLNVVYSKEAIEESDRFFKTRRAYIRPDGGLAASVNIDTVALVMNFITGDA